jgi:hypothetical protein
VALTKPPLVPASPGQPLTAQAWNEILTGLSTLFDEVIALGGEVLEVSVVFDGTPVAGAQVTAEPTGDVGRAGTAVPPFAARTTYLLVGLATGPWRVHVAAPGFATETRDVTLPHEGPLVVELERDGVAVPDLFGIGLRGALAELAAEGLQVDLLFDTTGRELPRATIPPEYDASPVLYQSPDADAVVDPVAARVRLVVASALRREPVVTMPSLIGLTLDEAKQVLERLGLGLGASTVRSSD